MSESLANDLRLVELALQASMLGAPLTEELSAELPNIHSRLLQLHAQLSVYLAALANYSNED